MKNTWLIFLLIISLLALGLVFYRHFNSNQLIVELPFPATNNEEVTPSDTQSDIQPVQMDQFLDFDNLESSCHVAATCGNIIGVDCGSAVDGPYYYAKKDTGKIISYCGGYCLSPEGCTQCPPDEWVCNK